MTTTPTTPAAPTIDQLVSLPKAVLDRLLGLYDGETLAGTSAEILGAIEAIVDSTIAAEQTLPRFVIVQNPTTFGGDDCSTGYTVVDRTLAQPDATIGAVVLRGDFLECRAAAHIANLDPDGWDSAFTEGGF